MLVNNRNTLLVVCHFTFLNDTLFYSCAFTAKKMKRKEKDVVSLVIIGVP